MVPSPAFPGMSRSSWRRRGSSAAGPTNTSPTSRSTGIGPGRTAAERSASAGRPGCMSTSRGGPTLAPGSRCTSRARRQSRAVRRGPCLPPISTGRWVASRTRRSRSRRPPSSRASRSSAASRWPIPTPSTTEGSGLPWSPTSTCTWGCSLAPMCSRWRAGACPWTPRRENASIPFSLRAPAWIPAAFEMFNAKIEWGLEVRVDVRWATDVRLWIPVTVGRARIPRG